MEHAIDADEARGEVKRIDEMREQLMKGMKLPE